jgi:hypothetical protein
MAMDKKKPAPKKADSKKPAAKKPAARKPAGKMPWSGSPADKKADEKLMATMTPVEKARFRAGDKKHDDKKLSKAADMKMDKKLAKDVKKKY